jgi:uncharacterized membrane protein
MLGGLDVIPYGIIVLIASIALVVYFDFATEASWIAKVAISGIFIFCMASWFGWIVVNPLIRLFLLVALSVFIIFYRMVQQARAGK